jgi:hypothetical protein
MMLRTVLGITAIFIIYMVGAAITFQTGERKLARHRYECQSCEGSYYCGEYLIKEFNYAIVSSAWPLAVIGISLWWAVSRISVRVWHIAASVASLVYRPTQIPDLDKIRRLEQELGIGPLPPTRAAVREALDNLARQGGIRTGREG